MPFLTELDSRARIKGSRDPLGLQLIWVHFGRKVVGNLTTVTGSVRGFTTTILGYHFIQKAQERDGGDGASPLDIFLKFEQLAAYSRLYANKDDEFRGIERVKERLAAGNRVTLSPGQRHQILSNQKTYGLWGLFSGPARASGLLETNEPELTSLAHEFVASEYLPRLSRAGLREGSTISDFLRRDQVEVDLVDRHAAIVEAVASLLRPKLTVSEQGFYRRHLAYGGDRDTTEGRQRQLADLLVGVPPGTVLSMAIVQRMADTARRRSAEWQGLANRLAEIATLESLIAPAANFFDFLLARQGVTTKQLAAEVRHRWGGGLHHLQLDALAAIEREIGKALGNTQAAARWLQVAVTLARGEFEAALRLIIEQNSLVMKERDGSPWVRLSGNRLEIRFREETEVLAEGRELRSLWRHSYFIDSLHAVVQTLEGRT